MPEVPGLDEPAIVAERQADLSAVPCYRMVSTMPAAITDIAFQNKAIVL